MSVQWLPADIVHYFNIIENDRKYLLWPEDRYLVRKMKEKPLNINDNISLPFYNFFACVGCNSKKFKNFYSQYFPAFDLNK
jgi:hypothetical protein